MDRRILTAAAVVLLAGAVVLAFGGVLPGGGSAVSGPTGADDATATDSTATDASAGDTATGSGGATADTTTEATPSGPYRFEITNIEECGSTCREVTVELTNTGDETRRNVVVDTTMTADGDVVWEGSSDVGTLEPGETVTRTKTVDVGYTGGYKIEQNDGYVTIETVIDADSGSETYEERRKVA